MKYCPKCSSLFGDGFQFCPQDKSPLGNAPKETMALYDEKIGLLLDKRYRVLSPMGSGTLGDLYSATHITLGKNLAIKFLKEQFCNDPEAVDNFLNLARRHSKIDHNALVPITDYGVTPSGIPWFVMDYIEGPNIGEYIENHGSLPEEEIIQFLREIGSILKSAHQSGFIHQNLKPSNIKVDSNDNGEHHIKITDLGLFEVSGQGVNYTMDRTLFGHPQWMAPEQILGETAGPRTDIYAMGLLGWYMSVGTPLFSGKTFSEIAKAQLNTSYSPSNHENSNISSMLEKAISSSLEKNPSLRPQSIQQLLDMLSNDGSKTKPSMKSPFKKRENFPIPSWIIVSAASLVALIIVLIALLINRPEDKESKNNPTPITKSELPNLPSQKTGVSTTVIVKNVIPSSNLKNTRKKPNRNRSKSNIIIFSVKVNPLSAKIDIEGAVKLGNGKFQLNKETLIFVKVSENGFISRTVKIAPENGEKLFIKLRKVKKQSIIPPVITVEENADELIDPFKNKGN
jgi:serine/threonine protein kinase